MASPGMDKARVTRKRLDSCWTKDLNWNKYPRILKEVSIIVLASFINGYRYRQLSTRITVKFVYRAVPKWQKP